jgi:hypothetical protein
LETLHKQAKWYGYPYFIHVEQKDPKKFQAYLAFFPLWLNISVRLSEESMFGPESMYPAQGLQPPRVMTGWEVRHCPWYLDTKRWDYPLNNTEKQNRRINYQGLPPPVIVSAAKEGEEDKAKESAKEVNAAFSKQQHYANRAGRPNQKQRQNLSRRQSQPLPRDVSFCPHS